MATIIRLFRASGILVGHALTAVVGTAILQPDFWYIVRTQTRFATLEKQYFLSTLIPFALGFFVFWKWRTPSAKWIWIAGLCLFARRVVLYRIDQQPFRVFAIDHSAFWEMSGIGCIGRNYDSCGDFLTYTLPFVRLVFYSVGAWCCSTINWTMDWHNLLLWRTPNDDDVLGRHDLDQALERERIVIEQPQHSSADLPDRTLPKVDP